MLVFWQAELNVLFGILVVTLVACMTTGTTLALVFLRKEATLARLQTDFVSKVSHELRTPLTSIRMFAEMLQTQRDPEQQQVCLDVLQKETARLSERIERLLDWGRMEAGRRIYDRRTESVAEIVDAAVAAFDTAYLGTATGIEVDVASDLPPIEADRGAMVDAILNLLTNAWKYSGDNRAIRITGRTDGSSVRISVQDQGMGIHRAEHHRIFQKFYRVDDRLAREVGGSGLGLAIVRHVVHAHRGRVELDSELGRGSTFTLVLPRAEMSSTKAPMSVAPEAAG
jgi:two-component system phosphate regulon sensor histidine kinase PhoR